MSPAEAVAELARDAKDPDEIAKRLWDERLLGKMFCPIGGYVFLRSGIKVRVGMDTWYTPRGRQFHGRLPRVLQRFVRHYDNGDYDNLTEEVKA